MDILGNLIKSGMVDKLAGQFGLDKTQVESVIKKGLPSLTKQLGKNATDPKGLDDLTDALNDHKDRDLSDMVRNPEVVNETEGGKILDHIFGDKKKVEVEEEISKSEDVSQDKVNSILRILAPIVMVMLAKNAFGKKTDSEVEEATKPGLDLDDAYRKSTEDQRKAKPNRSIPGIITSMLDKDGDGNVFDDLLGFDLK